MRGEAYIIGVGETRHMERRTDVNTTELAWEAVRAALADASVELAELSSAITASQDFWEGRTISSMAVNEVAGATFKPESKVAADGLLALVYAAARIATGLDSLVLVLAHCMESQADAHAVEQAAFDPYLQRPLDPDEIVIAGLQAQLLAYDLEDRARVVAAARRRSPWLEAVAADEVARSQETASPLRVLERAPRMDGACALVLGDEKAVRRLRRPAARIVGTATAAGRYWSDRDLTSAAPLSEVARGALAASRWDDLPEHVELAAPFAHQALLFARELGASDGPAAFEDGFVSPTGGWLAGRPGIVAGLSGAAACARALRNGSVERAFAHGTTGLLCQSHHVVCLEAA